MFVSHPDLMPTLNDLIRARETRAAATGTADEPHAEDVLIAAQHAFNDAKRRYDNNKSKGQGDQLATPSKIFFGSPGNLLGGASGSNSMALENQQTMRRSGNALAVGMREVCEPPAACTVFEKMRLSC